jgi:hypothetical protein
MAKKVNVTVKKRVIAKPPRYQDIPLRGQFVAGNSRSRSSLRLGGSVQGNKRDRRILGGNEPNTNAVIRYIRSILPNRNRHVGQRYRGGADPSDWDKHKKEIEDIIVESTRDPQLISDSLIKIRDDYANNPDNLYKSVFHEYLNNVYAMRKPYFTDEYLDRHMKKLWDLTENKPEVRDELFYKNNYMVNSEGKFVDISKDNEIILEDDEDYDDPTIPEYVPPPITKRSRERVPSKINNEDRYKRLPSHAYDDYLEPLSDEDDTVPLLKEDKQEVKDILKALSKEIERLSPKDKVGIKNEIKRLTKMAEDVYDEVAKRADEGITLTDKELIIFGKHNELNKEQMMRVLHSEDPVVRKLLLKGNYFYGNESYMNKKRPIDRKYRRFYDADKYDAKKYFIGAPYKFDDDRRQLMKQVNLIDKSKEYYPQVLRRTINDPPPLTQANYNIQNNRKYNRAIKTGYKVNPFAAKPYQGQFFMPDLDFTEKKGIQGKEFIKTKTKLLPPRIKPLSMKPPIRPPKYETTDPRSVINVVKTERKINKLNVNKKKHKKVNKKK